MPNDPKNPKKPQPVRSRLDPWDERYLRDLTVQRMDRGPIGGERPGIATQVKGMTVEAAKVALGMLPGMGAVEGGKALAEGHPLMAGALLASELPILKWLKGAKGAEKELARALAEKLAAEGGFSVHPTGGRLLGKGTKGFAVGGVAKDRLLTGQNIDAAAIEKYLSKNREFFKKNPDAILGGWKDAEGRVFIEPSQLVPDRATALKLGQERGEQAVWDFNRMMEVPSTPKKLALEHYSSTEGLTSLSGKKQGTGPLRGAERTRTDRPPMVHFYTKGTKPERGLGPHKYATEVDEDLIYDISADPLGLVQKTATKGGASALERAIQRAGYSGYRNMEYPTVVKMFDDVPVQPASRKSLGRVVADSASSMAPRLLRTERVGEHTNSVFAMPGGDEANVLWNTTPEGKLNVAFMGSTGGEGSLGSGQVRRIMRSLQEETGATAVTGNRISGARPGHQLERPLAKSDPLAGLPLLDLDVPVPKPAAKQLEMPSIMTAPTGGDVFDVSKLGTNIPEGVTTGRAPVWEGRGVDTDYLAPVMRRIRTHFTPNALKQLKDDPSLAGWYDLSQARKSMQELSPTGEEDFQMFTRFMGPTSTGTTVPQNLRQASNFYYLWKNGLLSEEALREGTMNLAKGYANRRQASVNPGILRILEQGNLNPFDQPKTYRYGQQLGGNDWGGATLDMHVGRQVGVPGVEVVPVNPETGVKGGGGGASKTVPWGDRGFPQPRGGVEGAPAKTAYGPIEDAFIREANKLDLLPTQYQSLGWGGGAELTGVADKRPMLPILNERLRATAKRYGYKSPLEAWKAFVAGQTPLWAFGGAAALGAYNQPNEEP